MQNRNLTLNVQVDGAICTATITNMKYIIFYLCAVEQLAARKAHNLEVVGSNPTRSLNTVHLETVNVIIMIIIMALIIYLKLFFTHIAMFSISCERQ